LAQTWGKPQIRESGGARGGAVDGDSAPSDPDLALLIDAWPRLPEKVKADILEMVGATDREA
jgi:hypothetical protein